MEINRAKLLARLDLTSESVPVKKGIIMAALYLTGASYTQIAALFGVSKATVAQAARNHVSPEARAARPRHKNDVTLSWEQVDTHYQAALKMGSAKTAQEMATRLALVAKIKEDK